MRTLIKLEALCDALIKLAGGTNPASAAYQARNPGALKEWDRATQTYTTLRMFTSYLDGYQACKYDLAVKCSGKSRTRHHGLGPTSLLKDLVQAYGQPMTAALSLVKFLKNALPNDSITDKTPIGFFVAMETSHAE